MDQHTMKIFDFSDPLMINNFRSLDDVVMGGVSKSRFIRGGNAAVFTGEVSLENSGGFCSASSIPGKKINLSAYTGITLKVRGDGKGYKFTMKNDTSMNGFSYQARFDAPQGEWIEVKLSFDIFEARFRGRSMPEEKLDASSVMVFGFLIGDKQEGHFKLEIESIGVYQ